MSFDYSQMIAKAAELIERYGREVRLVKFDTDTAPGKPWRPENLPSDSLLPVKAVFLPPLQGVRLGLGTEMTELLKRATELMIIVTSADVNEYSAVQDGTRRLGINGAERVKIGNEVLVWYLSVKE